MSPSSTTPTARAEAAAALVARSTAGHELSIVRDDGLYRHMRWAHPESHMYEVELVTWPGGMAVRGDIHDGYVFHLNVPGEQPDILAHFRGEPDPATWASMLTVPRECVTWYSAEILRRHIEGAVEDAIELDEEPEELREAVEEGLLTALTGNEDEQNTRWDAAEHEEADRTLLDQFEYEGFCFEDTYEWDLQDWSPWYMWACHAIRAIIRAYDEATVTTGGAA